MDRSKAPVLFIFCASAYIHAMEKEVSPAPAMRHQRVSIVDSLETSLPRSATSLDSPSTTNYQAMKAVLSRIDTLLNDPQLSSINKQHLRQTNTALKLTSNFIQSLATQSRPHAAGLSDAASICLAILEERIEKECEQIMNQLKQKLEDLKKAYTTFEDTERIRKDNIPKIIQMLSDMITQDDQFFEHLSELTVLHTQLITTKEFSIEAIAEFKKRFTAISQALKAVQLHC